MTTQIELFEGIMGSGKTTAILEYMKENPSKRFLYITPLLSEAETRVANTDGLDISIPQVSEAYKTKSDHTLALLKEGKNISTTHALYEHLTVSHLALIKEYDYVVIIDEQLPMLKAYKDLSTKDIKGLMDNKLIDIVDGSVKWVGEAPLEKYSSFKHRCDLERLHTTKRSEYMVTEQLPIRLITSANRVILCTYMFYGNVLERFLSMQGITFTPFVEKKLRYVDKGSIRNLITLVGSKTQLKKIKDFNLSYSWYATAKPEDLKEIAKVITNVGKSCGALKADLCWSVPKLYTLNGKKTIKPRLYPANAPKSIVEEDESLTEVESADGIQQLSAAQEDADSGCYLPCSSIATNLYRNRTTMIHGINRWPNTVVKAYMQEKGFPLNDDVFALSELVQWVWRSAIRDGKPVNLCILSERMRKRFEAWLASDD